MRAIWMRIYGQRAWFPICRAHFSIVIRMPICLDETQHLIDVPSNLQVVDDDLAQDATAVNNEYATQSKSTVGVIDVVVLCYLVSWICQYWHIHLTQAAASSWYSHPSCMRKLAVRGTRQHVTVELHIFLRFAAQQYLVTMHKDNRVFYYRTGLLYLLFVSFQQALESLLCPVTILIVNFPYDIGDQEDLVEDVRDYKCPET
ncbi:hypothetical protein T02_11594 [Trichinella nativa]|uniref:Uncharacterized protein n=1 Tax=Trichinella nativa TaxID=6335 RepID=A0A0V1LH86_9BILA|nr:hypothetical protein T02_11594 [Trichinella nativa]